MTKRYVFSITAVFFLLGFFALIITYPVNAQARQIECGDRIESVISENRQIHNYTIFLERGTRLIGYAEFNAGNYENLRLTMEVIAPNNAKVREYGNWSTGYANSATETDLFETRPVSEPGQYQLNLVGLTSTGSSYTLSVSCLLASGTVTSSTESIQQVQCGSLIDNTFSRDQEKHVYYINLAKDDIVRIESVSSAGSYENLRLTANLVSPAFHVIRDHRNLSTGYTNSATGTDVFETLPLSETGTYRIVVVGRTTTGSPYNLAIGCTLADGTRFMPGDAPPQGVSQSAQEEVPTAPTFTGFGFPGLAPVDFTNAAQLPIPAGIPMSGAVTPTGNEILGYQFDAEAGDTVELSFNRLSGNLNLGLVVIDVESNVIYQASLVTTQSMTSLFTVPTAGRYTAGIFRISLLPPSAPEPTAFQVMATINP